MALPKNAIFGSELFGLNVTGDRNAAAVHVRGDANNVVPGRDQAAEIAYLMYGSQIFAFLSKYEQPMTDRDLYDAIRSQISHEAGGFAQFRQALDEMVSKGIVILAGKDPKYGDPLYTVNLAPT